MKSTLNYITTTVLATLVCLLSNSAEAVPEFARKYDMNCSGCHTAYPQLNQLGRTFKENGYRMAPGEAPKAISDWLNLGDVPISAILAARPYDKKDSGNEKIRAVHEVEIIVAGAIGKNWSGFFEIEAEDETGFEPEIGPIVLSRHFNKAVNLQLAYAPAFWADPYGFIGDHFRLTRGHVQLIDQRFGGADVNARFRANRQSISLYGRPTENGKFFYNVGIGGVGEDAEGENAQNAIGRVAYDFTPNLMIGAFGLFGEDDATSRDFSRAGLDLQADIGNGRLQAAFVNGADDRDPLDPRGPGEDDNSALSVQAFWTFRDGGRPTWVPLVRYDTYEQNDGTSDFGELTLNLTHYFNENIKAYIEYWDVLDAPASVVEDSRITFQLTAAF